MVAARLAGMAERDTSGPATRTTCTPSESRPSPGCRRPAIGSCSPSRPSPRPKDGYRRSVWSVPTDGSEPARRLTIGAKQDSSAAVLAGWSDARVPVRSAAGRRGAAGCARRPRGRRPGPPPAARSARRGPPSDRPAAWRRRDLAWSPDGRRLAVLSASQAVDAEGGRPASGQGAPKPPPGSPPLVRLPLHRSAPVDVQRRPGSSTARRAPALDRRRRDRRGASADRPPGPDRGPGLVAGRPRIAFATNLAADRDLGWYSDIHVVDVRTGARDPGHRRARLLRRSRPGCPTAGRSRSSGTASRPPPAAGPTSGCSRPTARTMARGWTEPVGAARPDARGSG